MKVVHLSISDGGGGAARAAERLHRGLRGIGIDSKMLVRSKLTNDDSVSAYCPQRTWRSRVARRGREKWLGNEAVLFRPRHSFEVFSSDRSIFGGDIVNGIGDADVVNLHWVANFFDYRAFFTRLPSHVPIVWTLHDMNPFTGGCHYDGGCGRHALQCGNCPSMDSGRENDLTRRIWRRKRQAFSQTVLQRMTVVAPSRWLAGEASASSLLGNVEIEVIPNGLDTTTFCPRSKQAIREVLGIPSDSFVVLFVADSISAPRKGIEYLLAALDRIAHLDGLFLLGIGGGRIESLPAVPASFVAPTGDDRLLSFVYSAADLFVITSIQDNLPNTVMEAIACGTPVVGFDVGGVPDMVRPNETGLLTPLRDSAELANAIAGLYHDRESLHRMAARCRQVALDEYPLERQAQRYVELYSRVVGHDPYHVGGDVKVNDLAGHNRC